MDFREICLQCLDRFWVEIDSGEHGIARTLETQAKTAAP